MSKKNTILIYTVNLGSYDQVQPIRSDCRNNKADYILFTDNPKEEVAGWTTHVVDKKQNRQLYSREIKLLVHKFVKGYQRYIYMDGNMEMQYDPVHYLEGAFKGGLLLQVHPTRDCIFKEAKRVIALGMVEEKAVDAQMRAYAMAGMKRGYGLFSNGIFFRDNSVNPFMQTWYDELEKFNYRDQLALPFLMWKHRPNVSATQAFIFKRYFRMNVHTKTRKRAVGGKTVAPPKVWYFTPGRGDKNLGRAYNDHCELVPDGDWICIRDGDTMFLNPFWSKQIEDIIVKHGHRYPLISCMTNRLGLDWQLPYGFDSDPNILNHAQRANDHFDKFYDEVIPSHRQTAGLFMLFPKSTWKKVPFVEGLTNNGTYVDFSFADSVMKRVGGIGIAKGIYLLHFYRMDKANKRYIDHLL